VIRSEDAPFGEGGADLIPDKYTVGEVVGRGRSTIVVRARKDGCDEVDALKVTFGEPESDEFERAYHEAEFLREQRGNRAFVPYVAEKAGRGGFTLVMKNGWETIASLLLRGEFRDRTKLLGACTAIAEDLRELHRLGWLHGDMKGNNAIKMPDGSYRLLDFNRLQAIADAGRLRGCGTHPYRAPEVMGTDGKVLAYGVEADIYSTGLLFWEMQSGTRISPDLPVKASVFVEAKLAELKSTRPALGRFVDVVGSMVKESPEARATLEEVIAAFRGIAESQLQSLPRAPARPS
jgi:serine/threonine protein kinase